MSVRSAGTFSGLGGAAVERVSRREPSPAARAAVELLRAERPMDVLDGALEGALSRMGEGVSLFEHDPRGRNRQFVDGRRADASERARPTREDAVVAAMAYLEDKEFFEREAILHSRRVTAKERDILTEAAARLDAREFAAPVDGETDDDAFPGYGAALAAIDLSPDAERLIDELTANEDYYQEEEV